MAKQLRKAGKTSPKQLSKPEKTAEIPNQGGEIEITVNGVRVEVSPELEAAVRRACKELSRPLPREMTTTQAAEFLDVSRPFVVKLVKQRVLPCRMVGKHHRIPSEALVAYREKMYQRAKEAADKMAQTSQELGLYDEGPPRKPQ